MFYKFLIFACLCFQLALAASRKHKTLQKVKTSHFCKRVDGCPAISALNQSVSTLMEENSALNQSVYALAAALEVQTEINSVLIGQVTFMQYEIEALFNSTSNPYVPANSVYPYDDATCRAIPYTNYTNGVDRGWVFFGRSSTSAQAFKDTCSIQFQTAPTCAQICAQKNQKCDPCGMAKLNCQDAVYWAVKEAKLSLSVRQNFYMLTREPPGYNGPWPQSVCANATFNGTSSIGYSPLKGIGFMESICPENPGGEALLAASWRYPKNYYNDVNAGSYIDPSTLCDLPVATTTGESSFAKVTYSTACYCRK